MIVRIPINKLDRSESNSLYNHLPVYANQLPIDIKASMVTLMKINKVTNKIVGLTRSVRFLLPRLFLTRFFLKNNLIEVGKRFSKFNIRSGDDYLFNPTMVDCVDGKLIVIARRVLNSKRLLEFILVSKATGSIEEIKSIDSKFFSSSWVADPRYFSFNGRKYVTYNTGHSERPNRIFLHRIYERERSLGPSILIHKNGTRRETEKNWGFFEHNSRLFAVYSLSPLVILEFAERPDKNGGVITGNEKSNINWVASNYIRHFGEPRGGASPVHVDGLFYCFFQSHKKTIFGDVYTGGVFVFKFDNGFIPVAISRMPLIRLNKDEFVLRHKIALNKRVAACAYTTGCFFSEENNAFEISYGINDYAMGFCSIPKDIVDDSLERIQIETYN